MGVEINRRVLVEHFVESCGKMAAAPRVAVVGGGLSGSLAALGLRARGLAPVVYDAGAGDRLRAAPFFRAEHDRFSSLLRALEQRGAAAPWAGEFGILGSRGGGYLSKAHVPRKRPAAGAAPPPPPLRDSGDFCGFVDDGGAGALWAATGDVCASLRAMGGGEPGAPVAVAEAGRRHDLLNRARQAPRRDAPAA